MPSASRRAPLPWGAALLALLGTVYCALQSGYFGESFCSSSGCELLRSVSVAGVSLWWAGVAVFVLLALCCLWRLPGLAFSLVSVGLAADSLLLALMLGIAPCLSCLGAALLLGLLFLALRHARQGRFRGQAGRSPLFMVWLVLFLANAATLGNERVGVWVLAGAEHGERRVYFSPSCPACRDAVTAFAGSAAFVPVMKDESDFAAIVRLERSLQDGRPLREAFTASLSGPEPDIPVARSLFLRLRLLRNKADILRLGFDSLPLLMVNGLPQSLRGEVFQAPPRPVSRPSPPAPRSSDASASGLPPELESLDQCKQDATPCDPPR